MSFGGGRCRRCAWAHSGTLGQCVGRRHAPYIAAARAIIVRGRIEVNLIDFVAAGRQFLNRARRPHHLSGRCSSPSTGCWRRTFATLFEAYITRSLAEEIDRIEVYYGAKEGGFWVAHSGHLIVGTFGLERAEGQAMELRRMYVDPAARRAGIARRMLQFAEEEYRRRDIPRLELNTSELQHAALALYRQAGYL